MRIDCPTCGLKILDVPNDYKTQPFCSIRCKYADLAAWFEEAYRIPGSIYEEAAARSLELMKN